MVAALLPCPPPPHSTACRLKQLDIEFMKKLHNKVGQSMVYSCGGFIELAADEQYCSFERGRGHRVFQPKSFVDCFRVDLGLKHL